MALNYTLHTASVTIENLRTKRGQLSNLYGIARKHINDQGTWSAEHEACRYHGAKARGCAAAPFILKYEHEMDAGYGGNTWTDLVENYGDKPGVLDPLAVEHKDFVRKLQMCHDDAVKMVDNHFGSPDADNAEHQAFFLGAFNAKMYELYKTDVARVV